MFSRDSLASRLRAFLPAIRYSLAFALLGGLWFLFFPNGPMADASDPISQILSDRGLQFIGLVTLCSYFLLKKVYAPTSGQAASGMAQPGLAWLLARTGLLLVLLIAGGLVLYRSATEEIGRNTNAHLSSVVRLKLSQIESWLDDGRQDIDRAIATPQFAPALQTWLADRKRSPDAVLAHLRQFVSRHGFLEAAIYDVNGTLLLSTEPEDAPRQIEIGSSVGSVFGDFQPVNFHGQPQLAISLLSPLRLAGDAGPLAWIRVNLGRDGRMSRLLREWPGPVRSAETMLLRRDNDEIVYLNVAHDGESPLAPLRVQAEKPSLLAARIIASGGGSIVGEDYRGAPVLGYGLPISGTAWFLATKIDRDEAFETLNILTAIAALMLGLLLLVGIRGIMLHHRSLVDGHRREVDRLALAKRYEILVKHANDCIIISDARGRIIDVNKRCQFIYGYRPEEMLAMSDDLLLPPAVRATARRPPASGDEDEGRTQLYEVHHQRKDGSVFPVEISEVVIQIDGERQIHRIVRDITERRASQAHIAQLSLLSITLANVNHAIAHSRDIEELFTSCCRACVDNGGFTLAWIGIADRKNGRIRVTHRWGNLPERLDELVVDIAAEPAGPRCPTALAFVQQRPVICSDLARNPDWLPLATRLGIGAAVALPISCDGQPVGVLTVYSKHPTAFGRDAECLLGEIANALSFAMLHFAELAAKQETRMALKRREEQLLKAEETAKLGHWEVELDSGLQTWSPQIYRLFERDPALGPATLDEIYSRYLTVESAQVMQQGIRQAIISGERVQLEVMLHLPDERTAYQAMTVVPVRNDVGRTISLRGTIQDITEHKLIEARLGKMASRLAQAAREYEDLYQNAPCGYHSLDKDGFFQRINRTGLQWLGYSREEVIGRMRIFDLLPAEAVAGFRKAFQELVDGGELRDSEQNLLCKDGSLLTVLLNATAIRDENGQFLMSRSTAYNMTERKKIEAERERYLRRLTQLSRRLVNMQEEERRRLSASLHDRTSPNLAAIALNLSVLTMPGSSPLSPELAERLEDIRALVDDTTASIREISTDLRPPLLDYAGLLPTLESYLHQFYKRTGTVTHFVSDRFEVRPAPDLEALLFRIAQEALTNISKHAGASTVDVALRSENGRIVLTIRDDGGGFDYEALGRNGNGVGLGMLNMREMTEFAGGRFTLESAPGKGTLIRVEI